MTQIVENICQLPQGWVWTTLVEILDFVKGKKPANIGLKKESLNIPYIDIQAFEKGIVNRFTDGRNCPICEADDILIVWDGARCGLVGKGVSGAIGSTLAKLVYYHISPDYLFYFLLSKFNFINKRPRGVGIPHVDPNIFWSIPFPLAPINEQFRIVGKVEELFSFLDAGIASLRAVQAQLKRYRQAVLQNACDGKLTEKWRRKNPNVQSSKDRWNILFGSKEIAYLPKLPNSWVYRNLEEVSEKVSVGHVGITSRFYCNRNEGVTFLRSQNVRQGKLSLEGIEYITKEFHSKLRKSQLRSGDLLIVRVGANRGDACIMPKGYPEANCANIVFARPRSGISDFLGIYFQTEICRKLMLGMSTGSAQGVINTKAVSKVPIPIPPVEEQPQIIQEVERYLSIIEKTELSANQWIAQTSVLKQSILSAAFTGKLVAQNPDGEPAEKLLERIKAERFSNKSKSNNQLELSQYVK